MNPQSACVSGTDRERWQPTLELATREVFELMLASSLEVPSAVPPVEGLDLTCMVGIAGLVRALFSVRCSSRSAARMAARMLGAEAGADKQQTWDAIGEIGKMVAGNWKSKISRFGDGCMLSVPTVMSGADYRVHSMVNESMQAIFLFEGEPMVVCLEIHS